jgi:hypothetical protein
MISIFAIEYHSYYAYLFYDFKQSKRCLTDDELARIDAIARKYVTMSCGTDKRSHHTHSCTFGHIIVHRAYMPALLDELLPVFEKITSTKL